MRPQPPVAHRMGLVLAGLCVGACQPTAPFPADRPCPPVPLAEGATWFGPLVCRDQRFVGPGDGRPEDLWLANDRLRAVLRHPTASLSLPGIGGVTVVDAAPWGRVDALYEAVPLVEGGALDVTATTWSDEGLIVEGIVHRLPDRPTEAEGSPASLSWTLEPGSSWITVDGADGWWIHPRGEAELLDGWLYTDGVVIGHDGTMAEDLGGAIVVEGARALLLAERGTAEGERPGPLVPLSGTAPEADEVQLLRGDEVVGIVAVDGDGAFASPVPATVDGVRAVATGRAPSPLQAPGEGLSLSVGGTGRLTLRPVWDDPARGRPVWVRWTDGAGREGHTLLPPDGGTLAPGAGAFDVVVSAGPAFGRRSLRVELDEALDRTVEVAIPTRIQPPRHVLGTLDWPGARDRTVRDTEPERMRAAVGAGLGYVVATARDDVATANPYLNDQPWVRWTTGSTLTHPDGWSLTAWRWNDNPRRAGHGAPAIADLTVADTLALASGGAATDRHLRVGLGALQGLDAPPWTLTPRPTHLVLPAPGFPPFTAWRTWFDWLDAGRFVLPSGPTHWLDVSTPSLYGPPELRRAVTQGRYSTGTGAFLELTVDGVGPGGVLALPPGDTGASAAAPPDDALPPTLFDLSVHVQPGDTSLRHLALLSEGGVILDRWTLPEDTEVFDWSGSRALDDWVILLGWSDDQAHWAVTAPIWTRWPFDVPATPDDDDEPSDTALDRPPEARP